MRKIAMALACMLLASSVAAQDTPQVAAPQELRVARPAPLTDEERAELEAARAERERTEREQGRIGLEAQHLDRNGKAFLCLTVAGQAAPADDSAARETSRLRARSRARLDGVDLSGRNPRMMEYASETMMIVQGLYNMHSVESTRAGLPPLELPVFMQTLVGDCHALLDAAGVAG